MHPDSPHRYRQAARQAGVPEDLISTILKQISASEATGVTPVLSLKHLSHMTGASYIYVREIVQRRRDPYTEFPVAKNGGTSLRLISAPELPLMSVQRWILEHILNRIPPTPYSYAYTPGRSIAGCANRHVGAHWLIKLDLHDFFHSVSEEQVYQTFRSLHYSRLVSFELARLCTRHPGSIYPSNRPKRSNYISIPTYSTRHKGFLAQGAPTSGILANLAMAAVDAELAQLAARFGLEYTRYADDLTFSSASSSRVQAARIIGEASGILRRSGFNVHRKKTKVIPPGSRHVVLGLLVDGDRVRLTRDFRRRLLLHIDRSEKFGIVDHAAHRGFVSVVGFINHVNGLIAFAHDVDHEWANEVRGAWNRLLTKSSWTPSD